VVFRISRGSAHFRLDGLLNHFIAPGPFLRWWIQLNVGFLSKDGRWIDGATVSFLIVPRIQVKDLKVVANRQAITLRMK